MPHFSERIECKMHRNIWNTFQVTQGDGRWGEVYISVITFAHLLVFSQFIANWTGAFIEPISIDTSKSTQQGVLSTLIYIWTERNKNIVFPEVLKQSIGNFYTLLLLSPKTIKNVIQFLEQKVVDVWFWVNRGMWMKLCIKTVTPLIWSYLEWVGFSLNEI